VDNQQPIDDSDQYPEGVHPEDITHGTFGQAGGATSYPPASVVAGGDLPAKFPDVDYSKPKNMFDDPAYSVPPEEHSFAASAEEFFQQAGGLGGLTHKAVTAAKEASEASTIAQFQGKEPAPAGAFPSEAQYDTAVAALAASEAARERAEAYHVEGVKDALGMLVGSGISAATDPIAAMLAVPSMGVSEWGLAGLRAIGLDQAVTHIAEAAFPKAAPIIGETAAHVAAAAPGAAAFGAGYETAGQEIEIGADRQAALDKASILYAAAINGALGAGLASLPGLARLAMRLRGEPVPGMPEPVPAPEPAAQPQVAAAESSKEAPETAQKPAFEGQIAENRQNENKTRVQSINGEVGAEVKEAVENKHLHAGAMKAVAKLVRMDPEKRDDFLRAYRLYFDYAQEAMLFGAAHVGDLVDEAESAHEHPLGDVVADNVRKLKSGIRNRREDTSIPNPSIEESVAAAE